MASCYNKLSGLRRHPVDRICSAEVPSPLMKGDSAHAHVAHRIIEKALNDGLDERILTILPKIFILLQNHYL